MHCECAYYLISIQPLFSLWDLEIACLLTTNKVKMLKDFDPEKIKVRKFDMPRYMPPRYEDYIEDVYHGKA